MLVPFSLVLAHVMLRSVISLSFGFAFWQKYPIVDWTGIEPRLDIRNNECLLRALFHLAIEPLLPMYVWGQNHLRDNGNWGWGNLEPRIFFLGATFAAFQQNLATICYRPNLWAGFTWESGCRIKNCKKQRYKKHVLFWVFGFSKVFQDDNSWCTIRKCFHIFFQFSA